MSTNTTARSETPALEQALNMVERMRDEIELHIHGRLDDRRDGCDTCDLLDKADALLAHARGVAPGGEGGGNG